MLHCTNLRSFKLRKIIVKILYFCPWISRKILHTVIIGPLKSIIEMFQLNRISSDFRLRGTLKTLKSIGHFRYPSRVIMNKAIQNEAQGNKKYKDYCFVSPGPRFELLCSLSLDQDIESGLFRTKREERYGLIIMTDGGKTAILSVDIWTL